MSPRQAAEEELTRVLALVPWIIAHPGSTKQEIAQRFGIGVDQLEKDLWLLLMVGVPPYSPGDYIDVDPDAETVEIRLADYFTRPLRLSPTEGLALLAAGRALLAVPGSDPTGPLATAIDRLAGALEGVDLVVDVGEPAFLGEVRAAAIGGHRIEIDYWSAGRDQVSTRRIDPGPPFFAVGQWYTDAFCHQALDNRMFRLDRIRAVRPTDETFTPVFDDADAPPAIFTATDDDTRVTVELPPGADWVAESVPVESVTELADGGQRVVLIVGATAWLERLLLQVGPDARITDPPALRDLPARAAQRILARYAGSTRPPPAVGP
jgi:proteasome accessory factor C